MSERAIQENIKKFVSRGPVRLFRNNVGTGWAGGDRRRKALRVTQQNLREAMSALRPGDVIVPTARPLHAGLERGSGDLIGWRELEITPDLVGQTVAVFTSLEIKSPTGHSTVDQRNWAMQVQRAGGIAGVARSEGEAQSVLGLPPLASS